MERRGSLPAGATCVTIGCAQCVPHVTAEKVLEGTRGAVATEGVGCAGGFDLHRAPGENPGHIGENHPE
jgi:hypothetical protein